MPRFVSLLIVPFVGIVSCGTTQPTGPGHPGHQPDVRTPANENDAAGASARGRATDADAEPPGKLAGLLEAHNRVRAQVGVPALRWSDEVAQVAQRWANRLAARGCNLQHSPNRSYGENLFGSSGPVDAAQVVAAWAAEEQNYRYANNSCPGGVCGHYTQVVWARSQTLGCGMATCGRAEVWVCNYDPPGNIVGQKPY